MPAWPCNYEPESVQGRPECESLRASPQTRHTTDTLTGAIQDAPLPIKLPLEDLLRGLAPEWRLQTRPHLGGNKISLASTRETDVLLPFGRQ